MTNISVQKEPSSCITDYAIWISMTRCATRSAWTSLNRSTPAPSCANNLTSATPGKNANETSTCSCSSRGKRVAPLLVRVLDYRVTDARLEEPEQVYRLATPWLNPRTAPALDLIACYAASQNRQNEGGYAFKHKLSKIIARRRMWASGLSYLLSLDQRLRSCEIGEIDILPSTPVFK